jgi:hypothetical protein
MSAVVIKPPTPFPFHRKNGIIPKSVFLAGSIELGVAENWQEERTKDFSPHASYIFNPRRDNWDNSWKQSINDPRFKEQVDWELTGLELAEYIYMYFDPKTKSPISLLELGLYANYPKKLFVVCPDGYWRKGNVEVVCARYGISMLNDQYPIFNWIANKMLGNY